MYALPVVFSIQQFKILCMLASIESLTIVIYDFNFLWHFDVLTICRSLFSMKEEGNYFTGA